MNYLAHIFLAGDDPRAQLGALLGDFSRPGDPHSYEALIERERLLHYRIDAFTDSHPIVLSAKSHFRRGARRFSGIVLDVLYDHFLAKSWALYSDRELGEFLSHFYNYLERTEVALPEKLWRIRPFLIQENWLASYQDYAGFEHATRRISRRLSRGSEDMIAGLQDVRAKRELLEAGFHEFFPELQKFVEEARQRLLVTGV